LHREEEGDWEVDLSLATDPWVWAAAIVTLSIGSFLYSDNRFYKFGEYLFVGVSAGYWLSYMWNNVILPNLYGNLRAGQWWYIFPGILGIFMLMRLVPRIGWISRWAISFIVGTTAGIYFTTYLRTNVMQQVRGTLNAPIVDAGSVFLAIGNIIVAVGVLCGVVYFFFSKEHKGGFGFVARVGIWFLMITFGASFGYTVMARISLLIGRMTFLLDEWLGVIP
jgi:hypothetical protein